MGRFLLLSILPLVVVNLSNARGWWSVCASHWQECKGYYLKWQQERLKFDRQELDCIKKAKNPREMNLCIRDVRKERREAFISWRREFGKQYIKWLREYRTTPSGKATQENTTKGKEEKQNAQGNNEK